MSAGAVAVRLFVPPHGKLRDMGEHGAAGHVDIHVTGSLAPLLSGYEVDLANVGDEVRVQDTPIVFRKILSFLREKLCVTGIETVFEHIIRVVYEFRVAKELKGDRLARKSKITAWLRATGVKVLMPRIERYCECRSSFPFKGPFRSAFIPDRRGAASGGNGDNLFVELALRFNTLAGIDLRNVS